MKHTPTFLLSISAAIAMTSCVVPGDVGYNGSGYSSASIGYRQYNTLPSGYSGDAYLYGGRYYSGGRYESGTFAYQGRSYSNRYFHNGQYYYGGSHRHYGSSTRPTVLPTSHHRDHDHDNNRGWDNSRDRDHDRGRGDNWGRDNDNDRDHDARYRTDVTPGLPSRSAPPSPFRGPFSSLR
jgi:hypothetical protein